MKLDLKCPYHRMNLRSRGTMINFKDDVFSEHFECPKQGCDYWITVKTHSRPRPKVPKATRKAVERAFKKFGLVKRG